MSRSGHQQTQSSSSQIPTQSWYPPSVLNPSRASLGVNVNSPSGANHLSRTGSPARENGDLRPILPASNLQAHAGSSSPAFSAIFPLLRNKSVDELKKLLTDKEAYNAILLSLEQVKQLDSMLVLDLNHPLPNLQATVLKANDPNHCMCLSSENSDLMKLRNDLRMNNLELARKNLEKEAQFAELRNQVRFISSGNSDLMKCTIIRTTEVAAALEKFLELKKREREIISQLSPGVLLQKLQDAANEANEESESLQRQLLHNELELAEFINKYRKSRTLFHRRSLTRLAAMSSIPPC